MEQKDYKAIAKLINGNLNPIRMHMDFINELVDYFEKENPPHISYFKKYGFNKKQFLKDLGVD